MLLPFDLTDGIDGLAERKTGNDVEEDRHRRLLALMIDLQRTDARCKPGHRGHRHDRAGRRIRAGDTGAGGGSGAAGSDLSVEVRLEEQLAQPGGSGLNLRVALQYHVIVV